MQDEKWALNKSKNLYDLLSHTFTYSIIWILPIWMLSSFYSNNVSYWINEDNMILFCIITFIAHTITDYFTSRIVSKKFAEGKYGSAIPNFGAFTLIGLDQCFHMIQLFTTYYYLIKI